MKKPPHYTDLHPMMPKKLAAWSRVSRYYGLTTQSHFDTPGAKTIPAVSMPFVPLVESEWRPPPLPGSWEEWVENHASGTCLPASLPI